MRNGILCFTALCLVTCLCCAAQQTANEEPQRLAVLRSDSLVVPFESLTNAEANCSIGGTGSFVNMQCRADSATAKASYHYVTVLAVDPQGMAYGIACRVSLIAFWCKKLAPGVVLEGHFDKAQGLLSVADGQKTREYQVLTSAFVGPVTIAQPAPSGKPAQPPAQPARVAAVPPPAPPTALPAAAPSSNSGTTTPANSPGDSSATCASAAGACVMFVSDPQGADIYVDGKFAGNTPSTLTLAAGSHKIRVEAARFKPWTRTLETSAGSKVTIRAPLEAQSPAN